MTDRNNLRSYILQTIQNGELRSSIGRRPQVVVMRRENTYPPGFEIRNFPYSTGIARMLAQHIESDMNDHIQDLLTNVTDNVSVNVNRVANFTAEGEVGQCSICLNNIKKGDKFIRTMCTPEVNHCFHEDCINEWFKANTTCPNCRADLK